MDRERLIQCAIRDEIMHSLLLTGPEGAGKRAFARRLGAAYCTGTDSPALLENNPNYIERWEMPLPVEQVRELVAGTSVQGFDGGRRAIVLVDAHRLPPQGQNAPLKALEEPPEGVLWILTGSEPGFLATIRSRCAILRFAGEPEERAADRLIREGVDAGAAELSAALADGMTDYARRLAQPEQREFRLAALGVLEEALFSQPPFTGLQTLLDTRFGEDEADLKKTALQARNAKAAIVYWQWMLRDALCAAVNGAPGKNADQLGLRNRIVSRFTIGQIQGIIKNMAEAEKQLSLGALAQQAMDALLTELMRNKEKQA